MRPPRRPSSVLRTAALLAPLLAAPLAAPLAAQPPTPAAQPAAQPAATRPTLVVMITVDQLRGDYHDRFRSQLTGGLARLYRGAVFTNGHHDHAITETAPGHASTLSGRFPNGTGITMNAFGVADPQAPLVGGGGSGASPFRFRGSTLTDWLRVQDPRTRALSVSRKDRGAILPLGRARQPAFWWANDGRFTTSDYYADTLPSWVQAFNARRAAQTLAGTAWTLLLADSAYAEPDSVPAESAGEGFVFPHALPPDEETTARLLPDYPAMDSLIADMALAGLQAESLGTGPATDVLAVSFSTTDAVGHRYGPDSRELHDQVLRLDRTIGRFLDSLFTLRDSSRVLLALTSDHGVAPLPGTRSRDPNGSARRVDVRPVVLATDSALQRRGLPAGTFRYAEGGVQLDRAALAAAGVGADSLLDAFAVAVRRVPGVQRADRWDRLARADTARDAIARRWLHMFPPDLAPDMVVTLEPYSAVGAGSYFQHGAPHDYDTHVPIVFYGPAFRAGRYDRYVRTVDIAATLAAVLGVPPTERLDGVPLREAIR
jgi:predicted AlkP superfamily pyrophosphatase or phosphodiesterase